jgi:hypothetical protein
LGDGSEADAARIMGLSIAAFREKLPRLQSRGFPVPDLDTGLFDLDAINAWRRKRHPHLFPSETQGGLTPAPTALDARSVVRGRVESMPRGKRENPVLRC